MCLLLRFIVSNFKDLLKIGQINELKGKIKYKQSFYDCLSAQLVACWFGNSSFMLGFLSSLFG